MSEEGYIHPRKRPARDQRWMHPIVPTPMKKPKRKPTAAQIEAKAAAKRARTNARLKARRDEARGGPFIRPPKKPKKKPPSQAKPAEELVRNTPRLLLRRLQALTPAEAQRLWLQEPDYRSLLASVGWGWGDDLDTLNFTLKRKD